MSYSMRLTRFSIHRHIRSCKLSGLALLHLIQSNSTSSSLAHFTSRTNYTSLCNRCHHCRMFIKLVCSNGSHCDVVSSSNIESFTHHSTILALSMSHQYSSQTFTSNNHSNIHSITILQFTHVRSLSKYLHLALHIFFVSSQQLLALVTHHD